MFSSAAQSHIQFLRTIIISIACFGLMSTSYANDDAERLAAAQKLVKETMTGSFVTQMAGSGFGLVEQSLRLKNPKISDEIMAKIKQDYVEEMEIMLVDIMVDMPPVYAKYFTTEELKQLLEFQTSPIGKKSLSVTPKIMAETMPTVMSKVQTMLPQLNMRFSERLKKQGHDL